MSIEGKRAIVCCLCWTTRVRRAVDRAYVDVIRVERAVVDAILCAIKVKRAFKVAICWAIEVKRAIVCLLNSSNAAHESSGLDLVGSSPFK